MKTMAEIKSLLGALPPGELPLALLPVQVQTRFVTRSGQAQLLVRVYPDELHLDSHDPGLTAAEAEWGRAYWRLIWPAARDEAVQRRAWERVADRFGARRAAWIAKRLTPTNPAERPAAGRPGKPPAFPNLGPLRNPAVSPPALARLLPDRWVVAGWRDGERVLLEAGRPIAEQLPVSPGSDDAPAPAPNPETLALDPRMRWLVDFDEAERVGMGIRVVLPAAGAAPPRFDVLLVFGLRARLAPQAGADRLETLLDAHHHTRGLAFVAPGTPTNNTADASSGFSRRDPSPAASFQVEVRAPRPAVASDAGIAARLLGLRREVFTGVEGAARTEDVDARHMHTALWPVTGGYYLEQILAGPADRAPRLTREQLDAARRHFVDYVRQLGPLPTLRVGRQPYGLLPVTSLDAAAADRFVNALRALRASWRSALGRAPRVTAGTEGADNLVEILRMQPASAGYRARLAFDRDYFTPPGLLDEELEPDLRAHRLALRRRLDQLNPGGIAQDARVLDLIPAETAVALAAALVQPGGEVAGAALAPDYVAFVRGASFDELLAERLPAGFPPAGELRALLYLLLRHSVLLAYAGTAHRILIRRGTLPDAPYREPVLIDIHSGRGGQPVRTRTLPRLLELDPALRAAIHTLGAAQEPEAAQLDELRRSLDHLRTRPVDVLARHLGGCLDLFAYRLDAWITSLATRRLDELRRQRVRGLGIGAFGWLENVAPEPRTPVSPAPAGEDGAPLFAARERGGFVHAPSQSQASAAAVLRSGYLTQPGENGARPFAIDLSSDRVRLAQWLVDGIRQGQPLDALLGYRFERGLHDRGLDRFVAGFRRVSRLAQVYFAEEALAEAQALPGGIGKIRAVRLATIRLQHALEGVRERYELPPTAGTAEIEPLAAAAVADGLALARLAEAGAVPFERVGPGADVARPELAALAAAIDALGDALTAEGVYQLVRGNPMRASASVDAVAHGEVQPPDLAFAETPRGGTAVSHRLAVLLPGAVPAAPPAQEPRQARAAAEPALEAWLRQMLGALRNVRVTAEFVDADGRVALTRTLSLAPLGIGHLDVLYLTAAAEPGRPSPLERLLEHHLRRGAPATLPAGARMRVGYDRAPTLTPAQLSLGELLEVTAAFRSTILGARTLDGRDLARAESAPGPKVDVADLRGRADRAAATLKRAGERLAAQRAQAAAAADPTAREPLLDALRERLVDLVFLGIPDAVPLSARGLDDQLLVQAQAVEAEVARRLARHAELAALGRPRAAEDQVRRDQERLQAIFGAEFRALPLVRPANAAELATAIGRSASVQGDDPLQALSWLQGVARVRPAASRVASALSYAAALGRPAALDLRVLQLPSVAGERGVALPPPPGGTLPQGRLSLVAHLPRPFQADQPVAGLVVDEWTEAVPAAEVTSAVAFNFDAPGARPPQSILVAAAPAGAARWEVETLEQTLLETLELARLRALDPQALGSEVLLQRALPALYLSVNLPGDALSTDFARLA